MLRLPRAASQASTPCRRCGSAGTRPVAVGELTRARDRAEDASIYHKNLLPVTYVTGDVAGEDESPVYAILRDERGASRS